MNPEITSSTQSLTEQASRPKPHRTASRTTPRARSLTLEASRTKPHAAAVMGHGLLVRADAGPHPATGPARLERRHSRTTRAIRRRKREATSKQAWER